jgi:hypothetical protein
MSFDLDPGFLTKVLGASVYLIAMWTARRPIIECCLQLSGKVVNSAAIAEMKRVEDKMEYKLISKTFLSGKSVKILKPLSTKLEIDLPPDELTFYKDLRNATEDEIKEWFAEVKKIIRASKRDPLGYLYLSRTNKSEAPQGGHLFWDEYKRKWFHQGTDWTLTWCAD